MFRLAQEQVKPVEAGIINDIVQSVIQVQVKTHKPGDLARRDVHGMSHGTVEAVFTPLSGLADEYAVGVFAQPGPHEALIRFSNGSPFRDGLPNVNGIAIKVKGIAGAKLLTGQETSDSVDFLMANHPTFFIANVEDYVPVHHLVSNNDFVGLLRKYPANVKRLIPSMLKLVKNPLTTEYHSQSPYLFGEGRAVKYALIPTQTTPLWSLPNIFDKQYLLNAVQKTLRNRSTRYTLCVQLQTENDSIEDPTIPWTGPLVAVATLDVKQRGDTPLLESSGETLSFNPWRTLAEHRPLGWANRLRLRVYIADSQWRDGVNVTQGTVPKGVCPHGYA